MKLLTTLLITALSFVDPAYTSSNCHDNSVSVSEQHTLVYICVGPNSKRYHKSKHCKGLNKCSTQRKQVTKQQAISIGRTPCKICY